MDRLDCYAYGALQALVLAIVNQFFFPVNLWGFFAGCLVVLVFFGWYDTRASRRRTRDIADEITQMIREGKTSDEIRDQLRKTR